MAADLLKILTSPEHNPKRTNFSPKGMDICTTALAGVRTSVSFVTVFTKGSSLGLVSHP
jgi:hypothetical protein